MDFAYPYDLIPDEDAGGFAVVFPDFTAPAEMGVITQGDDEAAAAEAAVDALWTALAWYVDERRRPPLPSPAEGRATARLAPLEAAKLALWLACADALGVHAPGPVDGVTALAARVGVDEKGFRRLLDFEHASKLGAIVDAAAKLGWRIDIHAQPIAAE